MSLSFFVSCHVGTGYTVECRQLKGTFEYGSELPASEWSGAAELSEREFHVEEWNSDEDEHDGVRNQKRTSAVTVAQVRKAPHVAQAHRVTVSHMDNAIIHGSVLGACLFLFCISDIEQRTAKE